MLKPRALPLWSLQRVRAERARRDLAEFSRQAWPVLEPGTPLEWNWHLDAICAHAQAALEDWREVMLTRAENAVLPGSARIALPLQRIRNLILNVPPGTGKSRFISVFTPAWMWTGSPQWRAIFVSGNPKVALRDARYCRQLIESEWYQESFIAPLAEGMRWKIKADQRAAGWFGNTRGGQRLAFGTGASITGDRVDALFVDDPNDAAEVESLALREAVNEWWDLGASNRVSDLRHSVRIAIMQRLHEDDWTGHVEQRTGEWTKVAIAQEFEPGVIALPSPIGWTDPRSSAGELMFPGRFPVETLRAERERLGERGYAGQHQQRPVPARGVVFRAEWFSGRYIRFPRILEVWSCWDTAIKASEENDETACVTAARGEDGNCYVLRMWHGREETPEIAKRLIAQASEFRAAFGDTYRGDYVEDKVSGSTLMQYVRREAPGLAVIPVKAEADKMARAQGVTPICEAGRVLLPDAGAYPESSGWVRDLLADLARFGPSAAHDDITDAFVYAVKRFLGTLGGGVKGVRRGGAGGAA